jgi:Arc/MetJ-type ribon-helix-helix transcriptional regulator
MTEPHIQFSVRVPLPLKAEITRALEQGRFRSLNEFMLTCIRAYLDETGATPGSRVANHQQLSAQLDRLQASVIWNMCLTQRLIANGHFTILDELAPDDAAAAPPDPDEQFRLAQQAAQRHLARYLQDQETRVAQLSEHLQQKRAQRASPPKPAPEE